MQPDPDIFAELLARFRKLPNSDRNAVLLQLPLEQRLIVEQKLRARQLNADVEDEAVPAAGKRYAHYSPNLARLLTAIEAGDLPITVSSLKPTAATCAAVFASVKEIEEQLAVDVFVQAPPFLDLIRDLIFGKTQKT